MFGGGFVGTFGEFPNEIWIEELARIKPRDIQNGIEQCKRSGFEFAPSLPKFLKLCEPPIVEDVHKQLRETQEKYLDVPKRKQNATPSLRKTAFLEMKNLLKFKPQGEMR